MIFVIHSASDNMKSNTENDLKSKELLLRGVRSSEILVNRSKVDKSSIGNNFFFSSKYETHTVRMFNLEESLQSEKRTYLLQLDESRTSYAAAEITLKNPNYKDAVSYTHLRAHETVLDLVCRLLLEKKK